MQPEERLTSGEKLNLSYQFQELNELLAQLKSINDEINEHMRAVSNLKVKATEIEHRFHKRAIEVSPSVVVERVSKTKPERELSEAMSKLKRANLSPEQLAKLMAALSKKDWESET
uniref:Uncharacterized protein n=1 Tax=viral metagenome TaxID=1070528 RepID=A0A6H1ZLG4_9ZZZZ